MITVESRVVFAGTPTTPEERQALTLAGFVHITGLLSYATSRADCPPDEERIGQRLKSGEFGKWDYNNGATVVVTTGGEVWIARLDDVHCMKGILSELCPNGKGAFVPLSNGDTISCNDLLRRVANPSFGLLVEAK